MSSASLPEDGVARSASPMLDPHATAAAAGPSRGSRSFFRQAVYDTVRRTGARVGLAWVALLVFFAVLAPFLANTHPYVVREAGGGRLWSPLLRHLKPVDVILPVVTLCVGLLAFVPALRRGWRWAGVVGVTLLVAVAAGVFVRPPIIGDWDRYRLAQREGRYETAVWAPVPYSPQDRNSDAPARTHPARPSRAHFLGTERYGADLLSQMIHASRIALAIGFISTGIAVVIGVVIGGAMGYLAGAADLIGMRLVEIFEAIPRLALLLAIAALFGPDLYLLMVVIGLTGWTGDARFIRAEFLRLRNQDFVQAATAAGLPLRSVLFRHMLPNGITPVLVSTSFGVASAILLESTLSFLGLGDPDRPSWGQLLNQARSAGAAITWWIALFPGLAIFLTVFGYNLIGEALRDALDPKLLKRE